ncbi:hypothetical protein QCA50_010216 [Cerrena zonata]|uniref:Uncharacterized protein n=1 Tax=Cerrena zonata TaxID=2478898 RepID=A0AAW0G035_9APHY
MNFTQSVGVTLNGTRGCDHGEYTINLTDLTRNLTYQHTYNGTTRWFMPDALLFYHAGLNPENVYQVTLTNAEDSTLSFVYAKTHRVNKQLSGLGTSTSNSGLQPTSTVTPQLPNPPNPSKLNIGIIIGPIVSGVLIVILVILLAIYLRRKPERKKSEIATSNTPVGTISPYIPHPISPKVGHTSSSSARLEVTQSDPQTTTPNDPRTDILLDIDRVVELVTQRILSPPSPSIPVAPPP